MSTTLTVQPATQPGTTLPQVTTWQLCACEDGAHSPTDRELAKGDRDVALRGLLYYPAGTAHLLRTTAATVVELTDWTDDPADDDEADDPQPYDHTDEHDYLRDDPWGDR